MVEGNRMRNFVLWCAAATVLLLVGGSAVLVAVFGIVLAVSAWAIDKIADIAIAVAEDGVKLLEAAMRWHERGKTR